MLFQVTELPETELSKSHRERNEERFAKFGWDFVFDPVALPVFEEVVLPSLADFVFVKKGLFVKRISDDISHVLTFKQGRYGHMFGWGVSLSFVPHKWDDGCRFHRTLKSARCDLFEYEHNLLKDDPKAKILPYNDIDCMHGKKCFREDLIRAWKNLEPAIRTWFASLLTLDDVLRQAQFQAEHYHWQGPKLVCAFTLARLGRMDDGLKVLTELHASESQLYSIPELTKALRRIANSNALD